MRLVDDDTVSAGNRSLVHGARPSLQRRDRGGNALFASQPPSTGVAGADVVIRLEHHRSCGTDRKYFSGGGEAGQITVNFLKLTYNRFICYVSASQHVRVQEWRIPLAVQLEGHVTGHVLVHVQQGVWLSVANHTVADRAVRRDRAEL